MADTVKVKKGDYIVSDVSLEGEDHSFSPGQVLHVGEDISVEFAHALLTEPEGDERAHTIDADYGKRIRADQKAAIAANLAGGSNEIPRPAEVRAQEKPPEQPPPAAADDGDDGEDPDETGNEHTLEAALQNGGDDGSGEDGASFDDGGDNGDEAGGDNGGDNGGDGAGDESKGEEDEVAPDEEQRAAADEAEQATSPQAETRETATPKRGKKRVKPPEDDDGS